MNFDPNKTYRGPAVKSKERIELEVALAVVFAIVLVGILVWCLENKGV